MTVSTMVLAVYNLGPPLQRLIVAPVYSLSQNFLVLFMQELTQIIMFTQLNANHDLLQALLSSRHAPI